MINLKYDTPNSRVLNVIPPQSVILDVGCATGGLGKLIRKYKNPKKVIGIDNDSYALKKAKKFYDKIFLLNIENIENLPFKKNMFDCIVFADVLEHTHRPLDVLKKCNKFLKKDGIVIISVPNFSFFLVRLIVLFGKFHYRSKGILDETHLRFFTPYLLKDLVLRAGLSTIYLRGYINTRKSLNFADFFAKLYPSLFAYQLLLVAKLKRLR